MGIEENVRARIQALIAKGQQLRRGNEHGQVRSDEHKQQCNAWFAPALNIVQIVCPSPENAYRKRGEEIIQASRGLTVHSRVGDFTDLLTHLMDDFELGLLSSVANRARAETFDNFLDHADAYYREASKREAGVIAGVVFEDSVRRVCEKYKIDQEGQKLDALITALTKIDVISQTKAKRARAATHVRTEATHAQWDDFDLNDVKATIDFTRELVLTELDS